ncbi:MAG: AraC family transcriptional regulator [Haliscomenobacteraceae bacterium CHB4]|nr:AraC family transcriptional regulator [Haliscomenobacteraceae bacterium CHB4]
MGSPTQDFFQYPIYNLYELVRNDPRYFRQLAYDDLLMTEFTCPLENRIQALWTQHNYFVYVMDGKKVWHTQDGAFELTQGSCVFVRKGANLVEQFFDPQFCVLMFFMPDEFIGETLRPRAFNTIKSGDKYPPVIRIQTDQTLAAYMQSMIPYFSRNPKPDKALLELKFRELLLNIADNPKNKEALAYFNSLLHEPAAVSLRKIMEDNFSYNLKLEEYAQLCNRSLSAFKRDFQKIYGTTPGKWLLERRLAHAKLLLMNPNMAVSEVAYDSGFENLSHFSRAFRGQYGAPPAAFRQRTVEGGR